MCNDCNEPCQETSTGCPVKGMTTDCVVYNGPKLTCSDVETNTLLSTVLVRLDQWICDKFSSLSFAPPVIINLGAGEEVYAGRDNLGRETIKTITTDASVNIIDNTQELNFSVDQNWLSSQILSWINGNQEVLCTAVANCCNADLNIITRNFQNSFCEATEEILITKCPNEVVSLTFTGNLDMIGTATLTYNNVDYVIADGNLTVTIPNIELDSRGEAIISITYLSLINEAPMVINWEQGGNEVLLRRYGCIIKTTEGLTSPVPINIHIGETCVGTLINPIEVFFEQQDVNILNNIYVLNNQTILYTDSTLLTPYNGFGENFTYRGALQDGTPNNITFNVSELGAVSNVTICP